MSEVESTDSPAELTQSTGDNEPVKAAIESALGAYELKGRYVILAILATVIWWQMVGPFSAFPAGLGFITMTMGAQSVMGAITSRRWPTTDAVVLSSAVLTPGQARAHLGRSGPTPFGEGTVQSGGDYVPFVHYEFSVEGRRFENARISPFDGTIPRRRWADRLIGRYPRGKQTTVRYDPDDPSTAHLRAWIPSTLLVFSGIGIVFLVCAVWFAVGMPGGAPVALFAIGTPVAALASKRFLTGLHSYRWPTVSGVVTGTTIEGRSDESGSTSYIPELQYEYEVDDTSYVSARYTYGGTRPSFNSKRDAQSWLDANYPEGAKITVHYDPDKPDVSVVEPGAWRSIIGVVIGLAFVVLGAYILVEPDLAVIQFSFPWGEPLPEGFR